MVYASAMPKLSSDRGRSAVLPIAAAAHNPVVRVLCESLQHVALADTLRVRPKAADRKLSVQDHLKMVAMLKARDPDGASAEVRRHIERNREIRRRYLARRRQ